MEINTTHNIPLTDKNKNGVCSREIHDKSWNQGIDVLITGDKKTRSDDAEKGGKGGF